MANAPTRSDCLIQALVSICQHLSGACSSATATTRFFSCLHQNPMTKLNISLTIKNFVRSFRAQEAVKTCGVDLRKSGVIFWWGPRIHCQLWRFISCSSRSSVPAGAYALAWLVGLIIVAVAYPKVVFRVTGGWARGGAIAITYAVVFAVGLLLIRLLNSLTIHSRLSILLVLAVTTTMSYFGSRLAIACTNSRQKGVCPLRRRKSEA